MCIVEPISSCISYLSQFTYIDISLKNGIHVFDELKL